MPIKPPAFADAWIADCASDSQFDEVLEAMDGVAACVARRPAATPVGDELLPPLLELVLLEAEPDESLSEELSIGNPDAIGVIDMAQQRRLAATAPVSF
jgi:hypothetical protein